MQSYPHHLLHDTFDTPSTTTPSSTSSLATAAPPHASTSFTPASSSAYGNAVWPDDAPPQNLPAVIVRPPLSSQPMHEITLDLDVDSIPPLSQSHSHSQSFSSSSSVRPPAAARAPIVMKQSPVELGDLTINTRTIVHKKAQLERLEAAMMQAITCTLCRKIFVDPVTLACGHSFCLVCANHLVGGAVGDVDVAINSRGNAGVDSEAANQSAHIDKTRVEDRSETKGSNVTIASSVPSSSAPPRRPSLLHPACPTCDAALTPSVVSSLRPSVTLSLLTALVQKRLTGHLAKQSTDGSTMKTRSSSSTSSTSSASSSLHSPGLHACEPDGHAAPNVADKLSQLLPSDVAMQRFQAKLSQSLEKSSEQMSSLAHSAKESIVSAAERMKPKLQEASRSALESLSHAYQRMLGYDELSEADTAEAAGEYITEDVEFSNISKQSASAAQRGEALGTPLEAPSSLSSLATSSDSGFLLGVSPLAASKLVVGEHPSRSRHLQHRQTASHLVSPPTSPSAVAPAGNSGSGSSSSSSNGGGSYASSNAKPTAGSSSSPSSSSSSFSSSSFSSSSSSGGSSSLSTSTKTSTAMHSISAFAASLAASISNTAAVLSGGSPPTTAVTMATAKTTAASSSVRIPAPPAGAGAPSLSSSASASTSTSMGSASLSSLPAHGLTLTSPLSLSEDAFTISSPSVHSGQGAPSSFSAFPEPSPRVSVGLADDFAAVLQREGIEQSAGAISMFSSSQPHHVAPYAPLQQPRESDKKKNNDQVDFHHPTNVNVVADERDSNISTGKRADLAQEDQPADRAPSSFMRDVPLYREEEAEEES